MATALAALVSIVMVGVWLMLSVFLWPHGAGQGALAMLASVLFISFASLQLRCWPWAAAMNVVVAVWLIVGALVLPEANLVIRFNHVLSSLAVLAFTWLTLAPQRIGGTESSRDNTDVP